MKSLKRFIAQMKTKSCSISEYGLIGTDDFVTKYNSFVSAKVTNEVYQELEEFAKSDNGSCVFGFSGNGRYLQAKSYVGTIQTHSGFTVEILPKIYSQESESDSKEIFLELLRLLYNLPNFKQVDKANFQNIDMPILEIFITMFLQEVGMIIKRGLKSDYINKEENLFYLKGKLLVNEQLKRNYINKERFYINHDEYSQNRAENRLLKSTLRYLANISTSYENIRLIRQYLEHMQMITYSQNIHADFRACKIGTRGMSYYATALIWSKIFLKKESFSNFSGDSIAFSILYPMEKLFENYVEYWLIENELNVDEVFIPTIKETFVKNVFGILPDIVVKKDKVVKIVADAKWKIINQSSSFSQSDFYQLFAYKHIYEKKHDNKIELRLYYPKSFFLQGIKSYSYFDNSKIDVIPLDMNELIKEN